MAAAVTLGRPQLLTGGPYVAFSLSEAMTRAQNANRKDAAIKYLGGMTRVLGMVHDKEQGDIILVGRAVNSLPMARLDDLVVALRARIVYNEWPEVSIEPGKDSHTAGRQSVVFRGHIAHTPFGREFVDCDVILKKYSMGALSAVRDAPSYKSLCLEDIKTEIARTGATVSGFRWVVGDEADKRVKQLQDRPVRDTLDYRVKFWFNPRKPRRVAAFQGVFCIEEMHMGVQAEFQHGTQASPDEGSGARSGEHPGTIFAERLSEHYDTVTTAYPKLNRLKTLFDLLAVAQAIRELENRPSLAFFLRGYPVPTVRTPLDHDTTEICGFVDTTDGLCHAVKVSGGIKPRAAIDWLNDGQVTALRTIILKSRPSPNSLWWNPRELEKWEMPNSQDLDSRELNNRDVENHSEEDSNHDSGCTVITQSVILGRAGLRLDPAQARFSGFATPSFESKLLGGVNMKMSISEELFATDRKEELEAFREKLLKEKPTPEALSWPDKSRKGTDDK